MGAVEVFLDDNATATQTSCDNGSDEVQREDTLEMCITFIKHLSVITETSSERAISTGTSTSIISGFSNVLLQRLLSKFPTEWRLHAAISDAWPALIPDNVMDKNDCHWREFGSFTLTFAALAIAEEFCHACMPDTACCFLASLLQATEECPLILTDSLRCSEASCIAGEGKITGVESDFDSFWTLTGRGAPFLGIFPSQMLLHVSAEECTIGFDEQERQSSLLQHDTLWVALLLLLTNGESVGTSILLFTSNHLMRKFEPNFASW